MLCGTKLTLLDLSSNYLGGELPRSLGNLKRLEKLDVSNNSVTGGTIPTVTWKFGESYFVLKNQATVRSTVLSALMH
ncbi:hypothetical protein DITRI_Ditri09bG0041300 [Diplodiscus trichospermus]